MENQSNMVIKVIGVALLLAIFIFTYKLYNKTNSEDRTVDYKNTNKQKLKENPYTGLRELAFSTSAEEHQLDVEEDELYGIVMDWDMGNAIVTVFSLITGDASIYISTGQVFIGGIKHKNVLAASKEFIKTGTRYLPKAKKTKKMIPTGNSKINFYLLTKSGRYYLEVDATMIENGKTNLIDLFDAGNKIISEYRNIVEE